MIDGPKDKVGFVFSCEVRLGRHDGDYLCQKKMRAGGWPDHISEMPAAVPLPCEREQIARLAIELRSHVELWDRVKDARPAVSYVSTLPTDFELTGFRCSVTHPGLFLFTIPGVAEAFDPVALPRHDVLLAFFPQGKPLTVEGTYTGYCPPGMIFDMPLTVTFAAEGYVPRLGA